MKKIKIQSVLLILILTLSIYSTGVYAKIVDTNNLTTNEEKNISTLIKSTKTQDFDPSCDVEVTFKLKSIRSLERIEPPLFLVKKIDEVGKPDFYVIVTINGVEFKSPIWKNRAYLYNINWTATLNVPDDEEFVNIDIQLWDWNIGIDKQCDISSFYDEKIIFHYNAQINYSIATGHWTGDDFINSGIWLSDSSGYGRLNGCDDYSYYDKERDCELWFDIYQTDPDSDSIPYWTEVNVFGTDPEVDNTGEDFDNDGCPIEWEYKWGNQVFYNYHEHKIENIWIYQPNVTEPHDTLDPDQDGLNNVEEYLTSQWGSDPFRKDLFVELDEMEEDPEGLMKILSEESKEKLTTPYDTRNIVLHLDDGCLGGGEKIPFTEETLDRLDCNDYYFQYFLHGNSDNWRAGVFHYALHLYDAGWAGYAFRNNALQMSSKYQDGYIYGNPIYNAIRRRTINFQIQRERMLAAVLMHELGHTLGIFNSNTPGCDAYQSGSPIYYNWWKYRPYISVMNYRYVYSGMIEYSDGSRGKNDFNDWGDLNLLYFQS